MAQHSFHKAEAAARLATPMFWAVSTVADVALVIGREVSDATSSLGVALVSEAAIYLALWSFMRGVRWAVAEA